MRWWILQQFFRLLLLPHHHLVVRFTITQQTANKMTDLIEDQKDPARQYSSSLPRTSTQKANWVSLPLLCCSSSSPSVWWHPLFTSGFQRRDTRRTQYTLHPDQTAHLNHVQAFAFRSNKLTQIPVVISIASIMFCLPVCVRTCLRKSGSKRQTRRRRKRRGGRKRSNMLQASGGEKRSA